MRVALIDHGMGNLRSVARALVAAGADVRLVARPSEMGAVDALCVPGQGIFARCMQSLSATGMHAEIASWVESDRPYLGICLGMQILFDRSEEGVSAGLGAIAGDVCRLPAHVRVPHIGWNVVKEAPSANGDYFYFDHSFAVRPRDEGIVTGWCEHGERFAAALATDSTTAVQFHPEKSGSTGIRFLRDWVRSA